ncbi:hypothetical protein [Streptomyces sp. NPDC059564]|uniref:hypothetical protein n=1 Tax=Streptomyces sp. NPDC059564 TaxID=3346865 RepID=UPI0036B85C97
MRGLTAFAAGAALAAATAGCGPADGGTAAGGTASPSAGASGDGKPGPGADRLKELLLEPGAQAGPYEVEEPLLDEPFSELYDASPAVCGPLTSLAKAGHTAQAYGSVGVPDKPLEVSMDILLRSYKDGAAAGAVMKSLAEAGARCAGGYKEERAVTDAPVLRVEKVPAPAIGDEALAYRIVVQDVKDKDISLYEYLTLVRTGPVTLSFRSDIVATDDFGGVPQEIVTAQWQRLARGTGSGS